VGIERRYRQRLLSEAVRVQLRKGRTEERAKDLATGMTQNPRDIVHLIQLEGFVFKTVPEVDEILKRTPTEIDHNLALQQNSEFHDRLDKWTNSATARRDKAYEMLEHYLSLNPEGFEDQVIDVDDYEEVDSTPLEGNTPPHAVAKEGKDDTTAQSCSKPQE
jgi:hypothetical protein